MDTLLQKITKKRGINQSNYKDYIELYLCYTDIVFSNAKPQRKNMDVKDEYVEDDEKSDGRYAKYRHLN